MMKLAACFALLGGASAQSSNDLTCTIASIGGDANTVNVDDLLALLANYGMTCAGDTCDYVPRRQTVHFDGAAGPSGDTGMMGWEIVSQMIDNEQNQNNCALRNTWMAGEQVGGLSSWYPGDTLGNLGCHDGAHSLLVTRSPMYWGPVMMVATVVGGQGSADSPGPNDAAIADGFLGLALRRVSDGAYVDFVRNPCNGGCGHAETISISKQGDPGEQYTIDVIDNYNGGWGWFIVNDFVIHQGFGGHVELGMATVTGRDDSGEEEATANGAGLGAMYLDSSDLELMIDGTEQFVGIRFPSVDLAPNSAVTNAWILFDVDEVDNAMETQPVAIKIEGEASVNSAPITATAFDISSRVKTTASTVWGPAETAIVHEELETDDISDIVNEITSMPGWAAGNPMTILFTYIRGTGGRWVESARENNGIMTPALMWSWDSCAGNYEEPCIDDYYGIIARAGYSCYGIVHGGGFFSDPPETRCAQTECPWMQGAAHGDGMADHHCTVRSELCPVACGVCEETPHDQQISSTMAHFLECMPMLDHEFMATSCCDSADVYHFEGPGGPMGDTGMLGWTEVATDPQCAINNHWLPGEMMGGLTTWNAGADTGCHDGAHTTVVTRSPVLDGPVTATWTAMGGNGGGQSGIGAPTDAGPNDSSITPGFMGFALRRVSDGAYVASTILQCPGGCGQVEQLSFTNQGVAGEQYTIDVIDNYSGATYNGGLNSGTGGSVGWGWMIANDFRIDHAGVVDTCSHLFNPDVHGVPSNYQTTCSIQCSQYIVPMWEQCGATLYWDDVQHGTAPPSDPQQMQDFYLTCKPVFDANPPPPPAPGQAAAGVVPLGPITASVSGRPDGAEETVSTGAMYLDSSDYEIMHDGDEQVVGIVFPSVAIEAGTAIPNAYVLFDVDEVRPGQSDQSTTVNIYGEANVMPAAPSTTASDLSSRTPTTASVTWQPETSMNVHDDLVTPDISSIVTEIISMDGWTIGNPMCILFGHVTGSGARWVESARENNGIMTPALVIERAGGASCASSSGVASVTGRPDGAEETVSTGAMYLDSSDYELMHDGDEQVVGITFPSVDIAPSDALTSCVVLFDVDEVRPGQSDQETMISIYGELNAMSSAPSTTAGDLSARTPTAANVMWSPESSANVHDDLVTPDISSIVSEITALDGWTAGNPMTILFGHTSGSGARWVESARENNGIMTPALMWEVASGGCGGCTTIEGTASVTGRPDGAEETVSTGAMYLDSSDYELMHDGDEQVVGITFPSVDIPAGSTLDDVKIVFDVDEVRPGQSDQPTTITIYGEANTASSAPSTTAGDLSSRTPTAAAVTWNPEVSANVHDDLMTPDISPIVNEITGLAGWSAGNPMTILFGHVAGSGARWVESARTNNGIMTPALVWSTTECSGGMVIEGSASVSGRPDGAEETVATGDMYLDSSDYEIMHDGGEQIVAVVFPSVDIPAEVTMISASVLFDIDEVRPGQSDQSTTVSIFGEANVMPAAPSTTPSDLSSRTPTAANVMWQPETSMNVHDDLSTPDISSIVTEIISMDGWAAGNPMCIMFGHTTGSGVRWVESARENNGIMTPALMFSYSTGGGMIPQAVTEIYSVTGRPDGAEETVSTGAMYLDSSDYEIMHDGDEQVVGITFPAVNVPAGAYIGAAMVIFDIDEVRPGQSDQPTTVNIYGELVANSSPPSTTAFDLSTRAATSAAVTWQPETSVNVHDDLFTPDLSSVVQEIVNVPGWAAGNSLTILFGHVTGSGARWVESARENNGIMTPALSVSFYDSAPLLPSTTEVYSVSGRPDGAEETVSTGAMYLDSSDYELMHDGEEQVVGITFPAVNVPAGVSVTFAQITFDVDEVRPGQSDQDTVISIYGQVGPAAPPSTTAFDLSTRPATASSVIWTPEPSVTVHDVLLTPDIGSVVNEIVNGATWAPGSGMGILFGHMSGSGTRWVESSRTNNGLATPAITITYN